MMPKCPTQRAVLRAECLAWHEQEGDWKKLSYALKALYYGHEDALDRAIDSMEEEMGYSQNGYSVT